MQMTKTQKIIASAIVVIVLLGVYILIDKKSKSSSNNNQTATTTQVNATSTSGQITTQGTGGYKIEQVPLNEGKGLPQPVPDLNRAITVRVGVTIAPEAKAVAVEKVKSLQARLKANMSDVLTWIDLGIYQKMGGDYQGAILSWKYASKLAPTDYVSLGNLGNLYAYFLKDNAQAEIYYKQAISKAPLQSYLYTQLAEVYRDAFKDIGKARAIIDQGLGKIPNDPALTQFKASLN